MVWIGIEQTGQEVHPDDPVMVIPITPDGEAELALTLLAKELQLAQIKLIRQVLRSAINEIDAYVFGLLYNLEEQKSVKGEMSDGE